jgi:murein L,D-transpeptidase YcbB/YkuD
MASFIRRVVLAGACALASSSQSVAQPLVDGSNPAASPDALAVRHFLDAHGTPPSGSGDGRANALWQVVRAFYEKRGLQPAWFRGGLLSPQGRQVLQLLAAAPREGLDSSRYGIPAPVTTAALQATASLGGATSPPSRPDTGALDVSMSYALVRLASDLAQGQIDPRGTLILWVHTPRALDPAALLEAAAASAHPEEMVGTLRPAHPQYALLVRALEEHRAIAAAGGWGTVPGGWSLRPGGRHRYVPDLRRRLAASGDLPRALSAGSGTVFDPLLAAAVRRFEKRHGLKPDALVDPELLAVLNVSVEERIEQIELNLERWRWLAPAQPREVVINVPTFELYAYAGGQERLRMKVVTGQPDSPTPIFAREMTTVVFSPYWNVPTNILQNEVLPAALRGGGYLGRQNMEVVRDGRVVSASLGNLRAPGTVIRQRPGWGNSLGLVKFVFPNPFDVYLHDTNEKGLFTRVRRAFSHGCVRVEKPTELARFVFEGEPHWSDRAIAAAMRSGNERHVALAVPVPITIGYFTTWVEADGTVRFVPDVYRHDRSQRLLLPAPAAIEKPANRVAAGV